MKVRVLHVHIDEYREAEGLHLDAPCDGHDDIQAAIRESLNTGAIMHLGEDAQESTIWVHHGYWPRNEVVEYLIDTTPES